MKMTETNRHLAWAISVLQLVATGALVVGAAVLTTLTVGAFLGIVPWLGLQATVGDTVRPDAGLWLQVFLTILLLALVGYLPANRRVRNLELTQRSFRIGMDDVARAYHHVHTADRAGVFGLSREFDAMRERLEWMRAHPELATLESDVLEVAAQMSVEARDLAEHYSDEKVARARRFLKQRQSEVEDYRQRIEMAQSNVAEIHRWSQAVKAEEGQAERQLARLRADLAEITRTLPVNEPDKPRKPVLATGRVADAGLSGMPAE
ncbi:DNA repair protein [Jannaschia sp. LMIT008]|uniref:DNA repair protein n=1 Tax=Jannaschia maritima TaxID=3032585 RepID=UPI0028124640|nr:DNA repair protein [Jannaschia sp. LMIT008]